MDGAAASAGTLLRRRPSPTGALVGQGPRVSWPRLSGCCRVPHRRGRRGAHPPGSTRQPISSGRPCLGARQRLRRRGARTPAAEVTEAYRRQTEAGSHWPKCGKAPMAFRDGPIVDILTDGEIRVGAPIRPVRPQRCVHRGHQDVRGRAPRRVAQPGVSVRYHRPWWMFHRNLWHCGASVAQGVPVGGRGLPRPAGGRRAHRVVRYIGGRSDRRGGVVRRFRRRRRFSGSRAPCAAPQARPGRSSAR
jgi:hypothetical protein